MIGGRMNYRVRKVITAKTNCVITLINPSCIGRVKTYNYHNEIADEYLIELGKLTAGETPGFDLQLQVVELCDSSGAFIRRAPADTWRIGPENTFVFAFTKDQGNAVITALRFYAGGATTELGSGHLLSQVTANFPKTSDYIMNVVYTHNYQNA